MNKKIFLLVIPTLLLTACNINSSNPDNDSYLSNFVKIDMTEDNKEFYTSLKSEYYQQRFVDMNNRYYYPRQAFIAGDDNYAKYYVDLYNGNHPAVLGFWYGNYSEEKVIEVESIDDITIGLTYLTNNKDVTIFAPFFKDEGVAKGWFRIGSVLNFVFEEDKIIQETFFKGPCFAPEVYYQGHFYYIQEAFDLGLINFQDNEYVSFDSSREDIANYSTCRYMYEPLYVGI